MRRIRWTSEAVGALEQLNAAEASDLLDKIELLAEFPEIYPARQRGRFAGLRYLLLQKRWLVYYRVDETGGVLIFAFVPALARP